MKVPLARGPLSQRVADVLHGQPRTNDIPAPDDDDIADDDVQIALWTLFELHYRGFDDASSDLEWDPYLLRLRGHLERRLEDQVRDAVAPMIRGVDLGSGDDPEHLGVRLLAFIERDDGPSVAEWLQRHARREDVLAFLRQRSVYHLKESDPHSFVLPRLEGAAKVALGELQYDEYGAGRPDRLHSTLFGDALEGAGLDRRYGAYVDEATAETLATNNVVSMFCLQRRLRGAAMGHLAAFEATSSLPCRKIARGIERVGLPEVVAVYFDEHVEADAVHEQVAARDICGSLVAADPRQRDEVLIGAAACLHLDALAGQRFLRDRGTRGRPRDTGKEASWPVLQVR